MNKIVAYQCEAHKEKYWHAGYFSPLPSTIEITKNVLKPHYKVATLKTSIIDTNLTILYKVLCLKLHNEY